MLLGDPNGVLLHIIGVAALEQRKLFDTMLLPHRPAVWRGAGRFHWLHRVPQLPGELPGQRGVHLDHQPAA